MTVPDTERVSMLLKIAVLLAFHAAATLIGAYLFVILLRSGSICRNRRPVLPGSGGACRERPFAASNPLGFCRAYARKTWHDQAGRCQRRGSGLVAAACGIHYGTRDLRPVDFYLHPLAIRACRHSFVAAGVAQRLHSNLYRRLESGRPPPS